jgi:hypothetical protein
MWANVGPAPGFRAQNPVNRLFPHTRLAAYRRFPRTAFRERSGGAWKDGLGCHSATSKKAAKEAAVAAGLAAVGAVLEELRPGEKNRGGRATKAHDEEAR